MIELFPPSPRMTSLAIVGVCVAALGAALASEHWAGLLPCILCIYQRYAYLAALVFGGVGIAVSGQESFHRLTTAGAGLSFLAGSAIAVFHSGVERKWWRGTDECHAPDLDPSMTVEEMKDLLLAQNFVPCDEIPWALFGISMANFNVLAMLALGLLCFWWLIRTRKRAS